LRRRDSFTGAPLEIAAGDDRGDWWAVGGVVVVVIRAAARWHQRVRGFGAKTPIPSHPGSLKGAPLKTATGVDGGGLVEVWCVVCGGGDLGGRSMAQAGAGEKRRNRAAGAQLGTPLETASGGDGGGWQAGFDVVDMVVCGRSMVQAGAAVWGQNRAAITRFGVEMWVNGRVWVVFDHLGPLGHMLKQWRGWD